MKDIELTNIRHTLKTIDRDKVNVIEIIAHTSRDFSDVIEAIDKEFDLKGVIYAHRPIDLDTGKPMDSTIKIYEKSERRS